jgi:hypothetical protein
MTVYTPWQDVSGTDFVVSTALSGLDGATGRVYALQHGGAIAAGMNVMVQGAALQYGLDYTFSPSAGTVTFTNAVLNTFSIVISYFVSTSVGSTSSTQYVTAEELCEFMGIKGEVPNPSARSDSRLLELVGVGTGTASRFYTDRGFILSSSYTFYYGATETAALAQALTETTHYTLDADKGILTLTAAGMALVSTTNIYAAYSYCTVDISSTELNRVCVAASAQVDKAVRTVFADGSATTPGWGAVSDEKLEGRGAFDRWYFLKNSPLPDGLQTTLSGDEAIGSTTLNVVSTTGFPSSGTLTIGDEKIAYSAKGVGTFTCTATTKAHSSGDVVYPFCFEVSVTPEGMEPEWEVMELGVDADLDYNTGRVYFAKTDFNTTSAQAWELNPPLRVPNRFRSSYVYGYDEIPADVLLLVKMIGARELMHKVVRKAHVMGLNSFSPELVGVDSVLIDKITNQYKRPVMGKS